MTLVPLTQGRVALIDDEDAERVLVFCWTYAWSERSKKARAYRGTTKGGKRVTVLLHRFVMNAPDGIQVDHIDNDGLNCQKYNLRLATNSQNHHNMRKKGGSRSRYKGVYLNKRAQQRGNACYYTRISIAGKHEWVGAFFSEEEAARAYDARARELHGVFARLNFPEEGERSALRESETVPPPVSISIRPHRRLPARITIKENYDPT